MNCINIHVKQSFVSYIAHSNTAKSATADLDIKKNKWKGMKKKWIDEKGENEWLRMCLNIYFECMNEWTNEFWCAGMQATPEMNEQNEWTNNGF